MSTANNMLPAQVSGRKSVVVLFTDGVPTTSSSFSDSVADGAINQAYQMKQKGATVYTIGIFDEANTSFLGNVGDTWNGIFSGYNENEKANRFMNLVSSNSGTATSLGVESGLFSSSINTNFDCDPSRGFYKTASNAGELNDVFDEISTELPNIGSDVQLDANSLLRDVVDTANFRLPANMESDDVTITLIPGTRETNESEVVWDLDAEAAPGNITGENFNITASVNSETSTVDVTGFSYRDYYVAPGHPGYKLVVKFEVQALHAGTDMTSNTTASAIYTDSTATTLVKPFEVPQVTIAQNTYVLDFGKKVEVAKTGALYVKAEPSAHGNATIYDTTDGYFAVEGSGISYQPQTTNWSSIDTGYVFGNNNGNYWEADSFLPATSVYYEDNFGYTSSGSIEDGYTTIEYTGDWKTATSAGASDKPQSSANVVYGTDSTYNDDLQYSDGSAHYAGTGATASFTFTGTGLEIYTSTNSDSGRVIVQIKGQTNGKIYTAIVDNEFTSLESGLYQIPTVFFQDVERDTYDATVTVIGDGEGNDTYYLDAIRVYNPLNGEDPIVSAAYADANEADAVSEELRQYLIDASTVTNEETGETEITEPIDGAVYIDNLRGSTSEIGEYVSNGPKNEVYLEAGKSVAFQIDTEYTGQVLLGIKAPSGTASAVEVTYGDDQKDPIDITSATDMYYVIHPTDDGKVVITNTGNALISITKLRLTGVVAPGDGISLKSTPELMSYAASFASLPYADNEAVENPDENTGNVDIENPEVPEDSTDTDSPTDSQTGNGSIEDVITDVVNSLWNSIWNGFSSWFGRW